MSGYSNVVPSVCSCCGAYSLAPEAQRTALLAVCDVLTIRALEALGKYVVRVSRSRYQVMRDRNLPWHEMHTVWKPEDELVDKALKNAWDVVPALLDDHACGMDSDRVVKMLDDYVHDLAVAGIPHTVHGDGGLLYRFRTRLGVPAYDKEPEHA